MGGADRQHPVLGQPAQVAKRALVAQGIGHQRAPDQHQRSFGLSQHGGEPIEIPLARAGQRAGARLVERGVGGLLE